MAEQFFVGIDISKATLDVTILHAKISPATFKITNSVADIKDLLKKLFITFKSSTRNTIYCAESMGIYGQFLEQVLIKKKAKICFESPLRIKLSMGIQRGKNDALDSLRIARYAQLNIKTLRFYEPPREIIQQLKILSAIRSRLIKANKVLTATKKVENYYLRDKQIKQLGAFYSNAVESIQNDIVLVEQEMQQLIQNDNRLRRLMEIITSISCVGKVIGTAMIISTNEFKDIATAKKFASYAGIAPFEYTSGTSVKGRSRVSHIANIEMKTLLHMAAIGYTRRKNSFIGQYYIRKVSEGKNKMLILNAIRNKIVHRIYSCIKKDMLFEELM